MKDGKALQPYFIRYIQFYIEGLTAGKEEFFLSLCDIEEEFLEQTSGSDFSGCRVVTVDKADTAVGGGGQTDRFPEGF